MDGRLLAVAAPSSEVTPGLCLCVILTTTSSKRPHNPTPLVLYRFLVGSSDSDSEDDKRVVRSAKDRRYDELRGTCDEIRVRFFRCL